MKETKILSHTIKTELGGKFIIILTSGTVNDERMNNYLVNNDIFSYKFHQVTVDEDSNTYIYKYKF